MQRAVNPPWRIVSDGCNVTRRMGDAIRRAGFRELHMERFQMSQGFVSPHIAGFAVK